MSTTAHIRISGPLAQALREEGEGADRSSGLGIVNESERDPSASQLCDQPRSEARRDLVEEMSFDAEKIVSVPENFNAHQPASLDTSHRQEWLICL